MSLSDWGPGDSSHRVACRHVKIEIEIDASLFVSFMGVPTTPIEKKGIGYYLSYAKANFIACS